MASNTKIEWTEQTWNPATGCTKVSPGCNNCYAEAMSKRLKAMGVNGYSNGFDLTLMTERLEDPIKRKSPTIYFVNSMSDLFHKNIPFEYVRKVFDTIERTPQHTYQILTKRAERMAEFFQDYTPPKNAWLGVTVEDRKYGVSRIDHLRTVNAHIRFLSVEPLLEDLGALNLAGIHWVIVGGESGPKARPMKPEWVMAIQKQCNEQKAAFFFKQWGGWGPDGVKRGKKKNGRVLDGRVWNEVPTMNP